MKSKRFVSIMMGIFYLVSLFGLILYFYFDIKQVGIITAITMLVYGVITTKSDRLKLNKYKSEISSNDIYEAGMRMEYMRDIIITGFGLCFFVAEIYRLSR